MRWVLLLIIFSAVIGCKSIPEIPDGTKLWQHDLPRNQAIGEDIKTGEEYTVPMSETDKWYMQDPASYDNMQEYRDELEIYIQDLERSLKRCRR